MRALAVLSFACLAAAWVPPQYVVDLDTTTPEHMWDVICNDKRHIMKKLVEDIYGILMLSLTPEQMVLYEAAMKETELWIKEPFKSELEGLAKCAGVSYVELATANFFYDVAARSDNLGCTGIIANDPKGTVMHGRNLDFGNGIILTPSLRNATITIDYMKGGEVFVKYTGFAGLVGAWTGQRNGLFTVEGNERDVGTFEENLKAIVAGRLPPSMILKQALFTATSYDDCVKMLQQAEISASVYYIIGGMQENEGTVITRNGSRTVDTWTIPQAYKWYIVETNYDHWNQPPPNDNRRATAVAGMNSIGSAANLDEQKLWTVMSTPRVLNTATVFTVIMSASDPSVYKAEVRVHL
eukprot:TRINITY_DN6616_c0_g2_i1.p1 TRINITY_DN6616_c0_g2~~TRINITY_DN6616_c0_g2_i1.p1  ORF type:complete len:354 (+),score=165.11 TRINITY_DN6616_c0_g2_i1:118-1179(+)